MALSTFAVFATITVHLRNRYSQSHYSQIPYLQIHILQNLFVIPKMSTSCAFAVFFGHAQSSKKFELLNVRFPSWGPTRWHSAFLQPSYYKQMPFLWLFSTHFPHFCAFCWWFCCLKWPPTVGLSISQCSYVQGFAVPYRENTSVRLASFRHGWDGAVQC